MLSDMDRTDEALAWQVGVWDRISDAYLREIDARFEGVTSGCIRRGALQPGESVLDLGTGTGAVAALAAEAVGPAGHVLGVDISKDMLARAAARMADLGLGTVELQEGRAEGIPAADGAFDVLIASLSLMYAIDRQAAARECARVLRPGGRFVAAVWAGSDAADIVRFQQTAGAFAPPPPVPGVGPGALADPAVFLAQLRDAGIEAEVTTETTTFTFDTFEHAWEVLAGVTTANLDAVRRDEARLAVQVAMWANPKAPHRFENATQFLVGERVA
jgi:SAM-dependent methyltransferase